MADSHAKNHDYHLVDPSPWPLVASVFAFAMAIGAIVLMRSLGGGDGLFGLKGPTLFLVGFAGVCLTAAGEKLAGLVLRRHRLVELFLVQVMGMSWAEVHDEAEQLEHVVSDRLIDRIDEMLGRPTHDPHGDPIPTADGRIAAGQLDSLLTCPVGAPLRVSRITDQDPLFLRFIERHGLKPGQPVMVQAREAAADAVLLRSQDDRLLTIGARAASKLLVEAIG